jgi:hypothetical protein
MRLIGALGVVPAAVVLLAALARIGRPGGVGISLRNRTR